VRLRCLIVDDSEEFVASATRLLESQGLEIVGAATASSDALRLAHTLRPDLALVDIELADEDGIELAQALDERVPKTRVVLISAYERDELSELVADSPAVGYLPKSALGAQAITKLLS
jgi:two-component system nitrate/nitrite response regulator NarL